LQRNTQYHHDIPDSWSGIRNLFEKNVRLEPSTENVSEKLMLTYFSCFLYPITPVKRPAQVPEKRVVRVCVEVQRLNIAQVPLQNWGRGLGLEAFL
jgi:hypothetical protein